MQNSQEQVKSVFSQNKFLNKQTKVEKVRFGSTTKSQIYYQVTRTGNIGILLPSR